MIITAIRSDAIYRKMKDAAPAEKENIYRDELMKPFEFKWACVGIPLKAETEGGCDVVSAAAMSGYYAPAQITQERSAEIDQISKETFWALCRILPMRKKVLYESRKNSLCKSAADSTV